MRVTIRTDSSLQIGTGHLMRCLTLADALRHENAQTVFICRGLSEHFRSLIQSRGHTVHQLPDVAEADVKSGQDLPHGMWLGTDWDTDARQTQAALETSAPVDWLIVDHYALDARWESQLRPLAKKIMVIDDLADRPHDCDLLLTRTCMQMWISVTID